MKKNILVFSFVLGVLFVPFQVYAKQPAEKALAALLHQLCYASKPKLRLLAFQQLKKQGAAILPFLLRSLQSKSKPKSKSVRRARYYHFATNLKIAYPSVFRLKSWGKALIPLGAVGSGCVNVLLLFENLNARGKAVVPLLQKLLKAKSRALQFAAAFSLTKWRSSSSLAVQRLLSCLFYSGPFVTPVHTVIEMGLARTGVKTLASLEKTLTASNLNWGTAKRKYWVRNTIVKTLVRIGKASMPLLNRWSKGKSKSLQRMAQRARRQLVKKKK